MNNNNNNNNNNSNLFKTEKNLRAIPNYLVIGYLSIITILVVATLLITNLRPWDYRRFDQLEVVTTSDWLTKTTTKNGSQTDYLVFIYSADNPDNVDLYQKVIDYANYSKTNKEALKIYIMEYNAASSSVIISSISSITGNSSLPILIQVTNGSIGSSHKTVSAIATYFDNQMK